MDSSTLHTQIQAALHCLTSPSAPETIRQAQAALLEWEEQHSDGYVVSLLALVGTTSNNNSSEVSNQDASSAATLRLAAMLSLKAAVVRRWKDRGRGKLVRNGDTAKNNQLLCESVKYAVRQCILQLVLVGSIPTYQELCQIITAQNVTNSTHSVPYITNIDTLSIQQVELLQDRGLQTNASALLSKIGRMDLPLKFHELIPSLVNGVQLAREAIQQQTATDAVIMFRTIQYNSMTALEALLSEMSSQRLLVDKKYRNEIATRHLGVVVEFALIPALDSDLSSANEDAVSTLKYAIITSGVVSYLMMSSFSKLVLEDSSMTNVIEHTLGLIHKFMSRWLPHVISQASTSNEEMMELLLIHCNFIAELQKSHALAFDRYLDPFLRLFYGSFVSIVEDKSVLTKQTPKALNKFVIAFLSFLTNAVNLSPWESNNSSHEDNGNAHAHSATTWDDFFTPELFQSLTQKLLLLCSCYIYTDNEEEHDDREYWTENPEGFYQWEMQRSSEDDVGCAAQNLLLSLIESPRAKTVILPWFVGLLANGEAQKIATHVEAGSDVAKNEALLLTCVPLGCRKSGVELQQEIIAQWDAVLTGAGLAGSILESFPGFNFQSWFDAVLGPGLAILLESDSKKETLPVIRRRIVWLLSCNAHQIDISSTHNPLGMLVTILTKHNNQNDVCVRLTAVQAIEALLPQCEEKPELLQAIVEPTIPAVYKLTSDCTEVENRAGCLDLISTLVTYVMVSGGKLDDNILNTIAAPLVSIWDNAIDQNLLIKRNVLAILSCLASYVGPDQVALLYPMALPMIDSCFQYEDNVFLVEEALKLWFVFLRLAKTYDALIGKLFIHTAELSKDFGHVIMLMRITEHYIILGGVAFLNDHAATLQTVLVNLIGAVSPRGEAYVSLVTEALLRQFPAEGGLLLLQCGVIKKFLNACSLASSGSTESQPDRVLVLYLTTMARVLIASPEMLATPGLFSPGEAFGLDQLISLYISRFQLAGNGAHGLLFQKLWALLLLSFYPPSHATLCSTIVLNQSSQVFKMFTYVIRNADDVHGANLLSYEVEHDDEEETFEVQPGEIDDATRESIARKDIAVTTNLRDCVSMKLSRLADALGNYSYENFLASIDHETLRELNEVIENTKG